MGSFKTCCLCFWGAPQGVHLVTSLLFSIHLKVHRRSGDHGHWNHHTLLVLSRLFHDRGVETGSPNLARVDSVHSPRQVSTRQLPCHAPYARSRLGLQTHQAMAAGWHMRCSHQRRVGRRLKSCRGRYRRGSFRHRHLLDLAPDRRRQPQHCRALSLCTCPPRRVLAYPGK
jgi:hypothetical protein